jgi:hypothetical protein
MQRRITMACMVGATVVVSACASEPTEPKTPADTESEEAVVGDDPGLSDEEFWAKVEAKEKAEAAKEDDEEQSEDDG